MNEFHLRLVLEKVLRCRLDNFLAEEARAREDVNDTGAHHVGQLPFAHENSGALAGSRSRLQHGWNLDEPLRRPPRVPEDSMIVLIEARKHGCVRWQGGGMA